MSEEILQAITTAVETAVDKKINGKLVGIKEDNKDIKSHLERQDVILVKVTELLEDQKFWARLWKLIKQLFYGGVSLGTAYMLYKKINK